jgi:hypothetical protein
MPYICKIRTDIPDGVLQVLDLQPNESQRNLIYEPAGQTKYIRRVQNDTVALTTSGGDTLTAAAYSGLAAYLLDNIEDAPNGDGLTAAQANTIALAIIAAMDGGAASTAAAVDALIAATVAGSGLTTGASTGDITEVLRILAGGEYTLAARAIIETPTGTFDPTVVGSFTTGQYRHTYQSGALEISIGEGHLSQFIDADFGYGGTDGAALIVYDDTGAIMT